MKLKPVRHRTFVVNVKTLIAESELVRLGAMNSHQYAAANALRGFPPLPPRAASRMSHSVQSARITMHDSPRYDVLPLNDDDTPMDFVVGVLEYFFGMPHNIAVAYMYRIHNHQKAICGTYSREEAEKKVADVLAFAAENKYPLQCILKEED